MDPSPPLPQPDGQEQQQQRIPSPPMPVPQSPVESPSRTRRLAPSRPRELPIKDAVNDAFDHSPAMNQMDPDLISQITKSVTEHVMQSLQGRGLQSNGPTPIPTPSVPQPQMQFPPPPPPATQPTPQSPAQSSTASSIPQRFTPPTPERSNYRRAEARSFDSSSPEPPPSDTSSRESERSRETPRPSAPDARSRVPGRASSRRQADDGRRSSASSMTRKDGRIPFRRDSRGSDRSYDGPSRSRPRPKRVPSVGLDEEATTLEKIWQPLFDNGNPTMRLSQFLRGLAIHLIDDYEPKGSHVVTPAKLLRFFNETKVEDEHYPWDIIFGGKMTNASISVMYRKLLCQHHLVQVQNHEVPSVPALTPYGFEWFMTCLIQAHPDTEFDRLAKAVMNMPISNADNCSERFPKELSRRLLPIEPSVPAEQRLISSLVHEPHLFSNLRGASNMPPPPASAPPHAQNGFAERERKPYSQTSSHSNAIDDDDLAPPSVQIERERKPYAAKEGGGKIYNSDDGRPSTTQYRGDQRSSRINSNAPPPGVYGSNGGGQSDPMNIPRNKTPHRMSTGGPPPGMSGSYSRVGRRTPPPRNPYARSEPVDVSGMSSSAYASNLNPREPYPGDYEDDPLRRYPSRPPQRERAGTNGIAQDDDPRGYPIPSRGMPVNSNGYDYGGGAPPVGSFPNRRPPLGGSNNDDRRRSMYASSPAQGGMGATDGGTDGYGSFAQNMGGGYPPQAYGSSVAH